MSIETQFTLARMVGLRIARVSGLERYSDCVDIVMTHLFTDAEYLAQFYHQSDCCEVVRLEDFDIDDVVGGIVLSAEEVSEMPECGGNPLPDTSTEESCTWTFYKIETDKGGIWMRWLGTSNGYYSEDVTVRFRPMYDNAEEVDDDH